MTRIHIESDHKPAVATLVENSLAMQQKAVRAGLKRTRLRLKAFEKEFGQSSQQFYRAYQAGEMGDDGAHMEWAGEWEDLSGINAGARTAERDRSVLIEEYFVHLERTFAACLYMTQTTLTKEKRALHMVS